jgi:aspartate 1-decarboxylase
MATASELTINTTATALQMADTMFGEGVTVLSATYTGAATASGIYTGANTTMPGMAPADSGVILSTGTAADITNSSGQTNTSDGTTTIHNTAGDAGLTAIAGMQTFDAAVLEVQFIPVGDTLTMQLVFSSEEYLEYVGGGVNDSVGVWVNGVQATLSFGSGNISIDTINTTTNSNLYVDNPAGTNLVNTEMDGLTVTLTIKAPVNAGVSNTFRIGIADGGDGAYDSNLMIVADSLQTVLIANDDTVSVFPSTQKTVDLLANDQSEPTATVTVTELNGQSVSPGDSVVLATGQTLTLNVDGTVTVTSAAGATSTVFSYTISDGNGTMDVAYVTLNTAACFVAGTLIDTPDGPMPIEAIRPGTLVITRDHGPRPVRWIGFSTRKAEGRDAPVVFETGTMGNSRRLMVSQNHRMLVSTPMVELLYGCSEVLVKARDLVNGSDIHIVERDRMVTYVHLLFDEHEIITANGCLSESYHPGDQSIDSFDNATRSEILQLFPEIADLEVANWLPTARMALKGYEARVLRPVTLH